MIDLKLFPKYQKELLAFINTDFGRDYISHLGGFEIKDRRFPFVKIDHEGVHQLLGFEGNKAVYRAIFYPGNQFRKLFAPALQKMEIAERAGFRIKDPDLIPYVVAHFINETRKLKGQLPLIFLSTLTSNPDTGTGATSVDGYVNQHYAAGSGVAWSTLISDTGNDSLGGSFLYPFDILSDTVSNNWTDQLRNKINFDTSSLGSTAMISAAILSIYGVFSNGDALGITPNYNIFSHGGTTNTIPSSDYSLFSPTKLSSDYPLSSWNAAGYNDSTLNGFGIGVINLTGVSKLGTRNSNYDVAGVAPTWSSRKESYIQGYASDNGTNKPKLVITYTLSSPSSSVSASQSPSASVSPSASNSPSVSPSASTSPSSSISSSPSASVSPSSSVSKSVSPSSSVSASVSPSASVSASVSPSSSVSASVSPSASRSPSSSISPSISPSSSISVSMSPSPSEGFTLDSRGDYVTLPLNDNDLETLYDDNEEESVLNYDGALVGQTGAQQYMVHQFKRFVTTETFGGIIVRGRSQLAPDLSPVYVQIFNRSTNLWETVGSLSDADEDVDFEIKVKIPDMSAYKDGSNIVSCRVYQYADIVN